jgi:hypothetical protein
MADFKLGGSYSHWAYCDICGGKYKNDKLRKNWKNQLVCAEDYETRHSLDFYRPRNDSHVLTSPGNKEGKEPYLVLGSYVDGYNEFNELPSNHNSGINQTYEISATPTSDWTTNTTTDNLTIMAWVKPLCVHDNKFMVVFGTRSATAAGSWSFDIGGNGSTAIGVLALFGPSTFQCRSLTNTIVAGQWQHVAAVKNSSDSHYYLYLNGQPMANIRTTPVSITGNTDTVLLGRLSTANTARNFVGSMKDLRVFNSYKTQNQIQRYMNDYRNFSSTESGLIGWWKLNEGGGSTIYDSQTNYDPMNFAIVDDTHVSWEYDER